MQQTFISFNGNPFQFNNFTMQTVFSSKYRGNTQENFILLRRFSWKAFSPLNPLKISTKCTGYILKKCNSLSFNGNPFQFNNFTMQNCFLIKVPMMIMIQSKTKFFKGFYFPSFCNSLEQYNCVLFYSDYRDWFLLLSNQSQHAAEWPAGNILTTLRGRHHIIILLSHIIIIFSSSASYLHFIYQVS